MRHEPVRTASWKARRTLLGEVIAMGGVPLSMSPLEVELLARADGSGVEITHDDLLLGMESVSRARLVYFNYAPWHLPGACGRRLGEMLVHRLQATPADVEAALVRQRNLGRGPYKFLGELLIEAGAVPLGAVEAALQRQRQRPFRPSSRPAPSALPAMERADVRRFHDALLLREGSQAGALYALGRCFLTGTGVARDLGQARLALTAAADLAAPTSPLRYQAPLILALALDPLAEDPRPLYRQGFEAVDAFVQAGYLEDEGLETAVGLERGPNPGLAAASYLAAARAGHRLALGVLAGREWQFSQILRSHSYGGDATRASLELDVLRAVAQQVLANRASPGLAPALRLRPAPGDAPTLGGSNRT